MKSVALVSSYREGRLVQAAVRSGLQACGQVLVFDGPAGPAHDRGHPSDFSPFRREPNVVVRHGEWDTDAGKRSAMLKWCRRYDVHAPVWAVWIDGDEVLLWPELLTDYLIKAQELHPDAVAMSIKIVEHDGTVADCGAKVIRADLVDEILESSYQLKARFSDAVLSLPNSPAKEAPLPGTPHLLHRSFLRPEDRAGERLHLRESDFYVERSAEIGLPAEVTLGAGA